MLPKLTKPRLKCAPENVHVYDNKQITQQALSREA